MTILSFIFLLALLGVCVVVTIAAATMAVSEKGWSGSLSSVSWVFLTLACALWLLFFWLQPFKITLELVK